MILKIAGAPNWSIQSSQWKMPIFIEEVFVVKDVPYNKREKNNLVAQD